MNSDKDTIYMKVIEKNEAYNFIVMDLFFILIPSTKVMQCPHLYF
jgi:hypothetical protein